MHDPFQEERLSPYDFDREAGIEERLEAQGNPLRREDAGARRRRTSITPLDVWTAIKTVLRRELGEIEWEMWIQHARLWRVLGEGTEHQTLGVVLPRQGRAIYGALRHMKRVRALAGKMMLGVLVSPAVDLGAHELKRQAIEELPAGDPRKARMLDKWEDQHIYLSHPFLEPACSPLWEGQ